MGTSFVPGAVSVVIPSYNQRPDRLRAAVESALAQSPVPEVVVVDDGSTVPISACDVPGARVVTHDGNKGIATALNTGVGASTGEWVCWLSSDDTFLPGKVEQQLAACLRFGAKACYTRYSVHHGDGVTVGEVPPPPYTRPPVLPFWSWPLLEHGGPFARGCWVNGSTTMLHRSVFDDVGLFDPSFRWAQDYEMWCRVARKYRWLLVNKVLGTRCESGNETERIRADPAKVAIAQEEDRRVHALYGVES